MRHCIACRLVTSRGCAEPAPRQASMPLCAFDIGKLDLDRPAVSVRQDGVFGLRPLQAPTIVVTALHPQNAD